MNTDFQGLQARFTALGGIAENVCQREGAYGRGMFPIDPLRGTKIMTPENLLIDAANLCLDGENILIKDRKDRAAEDIEFLETYCNDFHGAMVAIMILFLS